MDDVLLQLAWTLATLSPLSIGNVATILPQMEQAVVGQGWMTHAQFMEAYALSQMVPGPASTLIVVPIGYQAAGPAGALVALLAFYGPTALLAIAATSAWRRVRESPWPQAIRKALTPVAIGLLLGAVVLLGGTAIHNLPGALLLLGISVVLLRTSTPTVLVLVASALCGAMWLQP